MKTIFAQLSDNIKQIDLNKFWIDFIDTDLVYDKNILDSQMDRLRKKGVDIFGEQIRTYAARTPNVYADYTIAVKESKGQRTDIVTLTDSGDFLNNNIELTRKGEDVLIGFNDKKDDGLISDNVDLKNVFGWTDTDIDFLIDYILPKFQDYIIKTMLNGIS